ncbi:MAG: amino acid aminotransferase, partial [Aeromonas sp.]
KTAQAPGGTGALRIAAEFVVRNGLANTIWLSDPTWANHVSVFQAAGLTVKWYKYYDSATKGLDFTAMQASLSEVQPGELVLLHGCCHNPTGIDPSAAQWRALAKQSAAAGWLPLFDFAYQGFARGIEEDAEGLRIFAQCHNELLVASSFSKNFGLYNERVGAFTLVSATKEIAEVAFTQVKSVIRANYSNPPSHGAAIVTTVVSNPALYAEWVAEVSAMRTRIRQMRELLVEKLTALGVRQDFSFICEQNGMFSFAGLNQDQVARLKSEFAIYIVGSGRISVAGITRANIDPLCQALAAVL